MAEMLARIEIRCPPAVKAQVADIAKTRGVSQSEIGLAALLEMFERPTAPEAVVLERLARLEALLTIFVRVYLTSAPDPRTWPEEERHRAAHRGRERWDDLLAVLHDAEGGV